MFTSYVFCLLISAQHIKLGKLKTRKLVRQRSYWRRSGEDVQRCVCFVNIQSSLHENVVVARMGNAAYIIFIMWNSISGLDAWYHFRFNICCGVAVTVRGHKKKSGNF